MIVNETNLDAVKSQAKAFLYLDFKVEEKFGLFVQHPYFSQVIDAVQTDGKIEMVDLRESEGLKKAQDRVRKTIDAVKEYSQFFAFIRAPFMPAFFKFTQQYLSHQDYSEALADVWTLGQGFKKIVPVIGGVISGALNFASMMPMANRLQKALDSATFGYTEEELEKDIEIIENISDENSADNQEEKDLKAKITESGKKTIDSISGFFSKKKVSSQQNEDPIETLKKLSELKENGIITQEEFEIKKTELLSKI